MDGAIDPKSISPFTNLKENETICMENRGSDDEISVIGDSYTDCTVERQKSTNWHKMTKDVDSAIGNKVFLVEFQENTGFTTKELPDVAPRAVNPIDA